jgi:hypothetical protein
MTNDAIGGRSVHCDRQHRRRPLDAKPQVKALAEMVDEDTLITAAEKYSGYRKYVPAFLDTFEFGTRNPVLAAVKVLRDLNQSGQREVPVDAPMPFKSKQWKQLVLEDGKPDRRLYETAVLATLRDRTGDVWMEHTRNYQRFDEYLLPPAARGRNRCSRAGITVRSRPRRSAFPHAPRARTLLVSHPRLKGTAGDPRAAPTERRGLVGIIVAAGVHHNRMTRKIIDLEMRGEHGRIRSPLAVDDQHRQITLVALGAQRPSVLARLERIEVSPGAHPGRHLAVLVRCGATAVGMDVEAMRPRRQSLKVRDNAQSLLHILQLDGADRGSDAVLVDLVDRYACRFRVRRHRAHECQRKSVRDGLGEEFHGMPPTVVSMTRTAGNNWDT